MWTGCSESDERTNECEKVSESGMNGVRVPSENETIVTTKETVQRWWDRHELIKQQDQEKHNTIFK